MRHFFIALVCLTGVQLPAVPLKAQSFIASSSNVRIEGTSTVDAWTSTAKDVSITGDFVIENGNISDIRSVSVNIQTKSIKSDIHSDLMDERTHRTLKADKHPSIRFVFECIESINQQNDVTSLIISGALTIAGRRKRVELPLTVKKLPDGQMQISGNKVIRMTEFGIKPPVFMLGALRVGDELKLVYSTILLKKT